MVAQYKRRVRSKVASIVVVACVSLLIVAFIGLNAANANNGESEADTFGVSRDSNAVATVSSETFVQTDESVYREASALTQPAVRNISAGIAAIEEEERIAEEERRAAEQAAIEQAEAAKAEYQIASNQAAADAALANLPDVDWSVGKDAFVAEWTARIDAYLAGSPLEGYGNVFAEAAWNNGVDPRWSPAISNTESSRGSSCFLPYNAWGWGEHGWTNWEDAINAHVAGLAASYGYSLTYYNAAKYCPPNCDNWFWGTLSQMEAI